MSGVKHGESETVVDLEPFVKIQVILLIMAIPSLIFLFVQCPFLVSLRKAQGPKRPAVVLCINCVYLLIKEIDITDTV